jgi:hypothetical protein
MPWLPDPGCRGTSVMAVKSVKIYLYYFSLPKYYSPLAKGAREGKFKGDRESPTSPTSPPPCRFKRVLCA